MLDLTHIELATEEDKRYGIDHWASLFKAGTWEELKAMAKENIAYEDLLIAYPFEREENAGLRKIMKA